MQGHAVTVSLVLAGFLWSGMGVGAQALSLATGEYAPFVSQDLPGGGVLSRIVVAAFKSQGSDVTLTYLPWQRGYDATRKGNFQGTYPYVKNAERQADFLFSGPIFVDIIRLFGLAALPRDTSWTDKLICVPLGFAIQQIQPFAQAHGARLERPSSMVHCFQLLQRGRVQGVWSSEAVAEHETRSLRAQGLQYRALMLDVDYPVEYFLIVPKRQNGAVEMLDRFNAGLNALRKSGAYRKIVAAQV